MESNIRILREKMGLTQTMLAEAIGISQQAVSRMENDRDVIQADMLIKLADFFDVSTDYVLAYPNESEKMEAILMAIRAELGDRERGILTPERIKVLDKKTRLLLYQLIIQILEAQAN